LPAGGKKPGISADNGGLGAGRKQAARESDGQQPNDVPNSSGRSQNRVTIDAARLDLDARNSGTVDGRHVASPIRAPKTQLQRVTGRNSIRAGLWPTGTLHGFVSAISFECGRGATAAMRGNAL
jgi:hypothetical protein